MPPDEAICYGATVHAGMLSGDSQINDMRFTDVVPLSLGTDTKNDVFSVIIPNNTPIPVEKSKKYKTSVDNQAYLDIDVLQGVSEKASSNHKVGTQRIMLEPGPKGSQIITVTYEVTTDGTLKVRAESLQ